MKESKRSHIVDYSSSFDRLPDEIVLQILSKLIDLKTLCLCKPVSKRFYLIVSQVDTISFTSFNHLLINPRNSNQNIIDAIVSGKSLFYSAICSLKKFGRLKSLCIQLPSSLENHLLFKWKIKFGNQFDSHVFLSPNSIYRTKELYFSENGHEEEEEEEDDDDEELNSQKPAIAPQCQIDAMMRHSMLLNCIRDLPSLEKVSITDPGKMNRISLSGGKIAEMRNSLSSPSETIEWNLSYCYIPLLELPVSGYVMKGVTLYLLERDYLRDGYDSIMNIDDDINFEDKEEAAYSEAMMEILKNFRDEIEMLV